MVVNVDDIGARLGLLGILGGLVNEGSDKLVAHVGDDGRYQRFSIGFSELTPST